MKALILGAAGQVGRALQATAPSGVEVEALTRAEADLANSKALAAVIAASKASVILNAAAYTAVDRAETEEPLARAANALAVEALAQLCGARGALLVHYSTDYVFDGSGDRAWMEDDPTAPLGVYGRTKLEGEQAALASDASCLIVRTSWVYAPAGQNFVRTMLRLGRDREELAVVDDQTGAPTLAEDLARGTWRAVEAWANAEQRRRRELEGIYHLCGGGEPTTWRRFAECIFEKARATGFELKVRRVRPVTTAQFGAAAPRPLNSRLNCDKFGRTFDFAMPPWEVSLERTLEAIHAHHPI